MYLSKQSWGQEELGVQCELAAMAYPQLATLPDNPAWAS